MDNSLQNEAQAQALLARVPLSAPQPEGIPAELAEKRIFAVWAVHMKDGKAKKPPVFRGRNGAWMPSAWKKPSAWITLDMAIRMLKTYRGTLFHAESLGSPAVVAGVGIVLTLELRLVGVDLDHCILPDGSTAEWAKPLVQALLDAGMYIEKSPSGTGIRAFCWGSLPEEYGGKNLPHTRPAGAPEDAGGEVYASDHFLTLAGRRLEGGGSALPEGAKCAEALSLLWRHARPEQPKAQAAPQQRRTPAGISEDQRFKAMFGGAGGARRKALFDGPAEDSNPSSDDMGLANVIVKYFGPDPALCEWAMNQSGRRRDKWEETGHYPDKSLTYLQGTIRKALDTFEDTFWEDECRQKQRQSRHAGEGSASTGGGMHAPSEAEQPAQEDAPWHRDSAPAVAAASDMPNLEGMLHPKVCAMLKDSAHVCSSGIELAFITFFSFVGALLNGRAKIDMFHSNPVFLNLYATLVAKSGTSKSAIQNFYYAKLLNALKMSEAEYSDKKKKYEEDIEKWNLLPDDLKARTSDEERPKKPYKKKTDFIRGSMTLQGAVRRCDANPCGVNVVVDELEQLFGGLDPSGHGGAGEAKSFLLSAYEGGTYSNARKAEEDELSAPSCLLSIFGAVQPEKLPELFSLTDMFSGFLGRFVFILYEQLQAKKGVTSYFNSESWKTLNTVASYIADNFPTKLEDKTHEPHPVFIRVEDEARNIFIEKYNKEHENAWNLGQETGPVDKVSVQVTKFIALIHIVNMAMDGIGIDKSGARTITAEEVKACLPLWDWFYSNFLAVLARIYAKAAKKQYVTLNGRDRDVLAAVLRHASPPQGRTQTVTAKDVEGWLEREGKKHPANVIAFALRKLLKPSEIEVSSNTKKHPNKYRFSAAVLDRLRAVSLMLKPEAGPED